MFKGTMIEDLIQTVEKTEQQARGGSPAGLPAPLVEVCSAPPPLLYYWPSGQAIAGVA